MLYLIVGIWTVVSLFWVAIEIRHVFLAIGIWTVVSLFWVAIEIRHNIFSRWYLDGCLPVLGSH
jgi:exosortase/archaeosortase